MDILTINNLVHEDATINNLDQDYTNFLSLQSFYSEIRTNFVLNPNFLGNTIRVRLSQNAPPHLRPDYFPQIVADHPFLVSFVRGLFNHHLNHTSVEVNFNFNLLLISGDYERFLYSSQNYFALPVSFSIHNAATKNAFFQLLSSYSVAQYIVDAQRNLSLKYEEIAVLPLSLHLHIRRIPNIVYGLDIKKQNNGLTKCCLKNTKKTTDCFFKSVSSFFYIENGCLKRSKNITRRSNQKIAIKIKACFRFFLKYEINVNPKKVFSQEGITQEGIQLFENFCSTRVDIWSQHFVDTKKIKNTKIELTQRKHYFHQRTRISPLSSDDTINLLSVPTNLNKNVCHLYAITNPCFFSKKVFCPHCNLRFSKNAYLKRHLASNVHKKNKFIPNSRLSQPQDNEIALQTLIPDAVIKTDLVFCYSIIKINSNGSFQLDFIFKSPLGSTSQSFCHDSIQKLCEFLINTISKISLPTLTINLIKNHEFLSQFETVEKNYSSVALDFNLSHLKSYIIQKISSIPCFITTSKNQQYLNSIFVKECLKIFLSQKPSSKITFKSKLSQFTSILATGPDSNLHIISLGRFLTDLYADDGLSLLENCDIFEKLNQKLKLYFSKDLINDRVLSVTELSQFYFNTRLPFSKISGFVSPSLHLQNYIQNSVKFGHLLGQIGVVHPKAVQKSYIAFDFSLFYTNILQNFKIRAGKCIEFEPSGVLFQPSQKLNSLCFANILFLALQKVVNGTLHFQLLGPEFQPKGLKKNYKIDCLITDSASIPSILEYDGCYHHACGNINGDINECHLPPDQKTDIHRLGCKICLEATKPASNSRPSLWSLKTHETKDSIHPTKKKSYSSIAQRSNQRELELKQSNLFNKVITLRECVVLSYWNYCIIDLLESFDIPFHPNNPLLKNTLGEIFEKTLVETLPIFDSRTKLTTQKLINLVKSKNLFGFLAVSGDLGPSSRSILKNFMPFSRHEDGKVINSFSLKDQLVSTEFLAYLLNHDLGSPPDFILKKIHRVFVYIPNPNKFFDEPCSNLKKILCENEDDKKFRQVTKNVSNYYIGNFSRNINTTPRLVLLKQHDFMALPQLRYTKCCELLIDDHYLLTLGRSQKFKNSCQNGIGIIERGRQILMKFLIELYTHCDATLMRCNTDGAFLSSIQPFPDDCDLAPAFFLDFWLKPDMSVQKINDYLDFKLRYLKRPAFCPAHKMDYNKALREKTNFQPKQCCKLFNNEDQFPLKIKIEQFGSYAIVKDKNQLVSWLHRTREPLIKCSGLKERTVQNFLTFSKKNLSQLEYALSKIGVDD